MTLLLVTHDRGTRHDDRISLEYRAMRQSGITPPSDFDSARIGHPGAELRQAALVIPVRQGPGGPEVFMMQRNPKAAFVPGVHVFPGGAIDPADGAAELLECCVGKDDLSASQRLKLSQGGLAFWIGALRECFEESGLLLAEDGRGNWLPYERYAHERWQTLRQALHRGDRRLIDVCRELEAKLALHRVHYLSHWITPKGQKRRFDTRFFVAEAPEGQVATHDGQETVASCWIRPGQALDAYRKGDFPLVFATRTTLEQLASFDTSDSLLRFVAQLDDVPPIMPRMAQGRRGVQAIGPRDPAFAEVGRIDAEGEGGAYYDIEPGRVVKLAEGLWRVTAGNPGYMTGPGTNTYILGNAQGATVIDPGPLDASHVQAIQAALPGPLEQILVTHTHADHSPAAQLLRASAHCKLLGWAARNPGQDDTFIPDEEPADGAIIATSVGPLRVLHTPGHAANHLCYLWQAEQWLFTGDHIMQGSTVVINPPDGNMTTYLASLQKLMAEPIEWLAPAHGFLMDNPRQVIADLIDHRLRRENLILRALQAADDWVTEAQLLDKVYTQLVPALKPVAARSLRAHLLKLQNEARAQAKDPDLWRWRAG